MSKPTVVLVPGAWHTPDGYAKLASELHNAGYKTQMVDLPSVNAEPALESFEPDVEAIRRAVIRATSHDEDIILFAHSYSGVPITQAAENLGKGGKDTKGKGGIVLLFYCTAFVLPVGGSLIGALGGKDLPWFRREGDHVYVNDAENILYNDLPAQEQQLWKASLGSFSYKTYYSELTYAGYKDIPSAFLFCKKDNAIPPPIQEGMVQGTGIKFYTESVDTSHSPFLSKPKEVADAIRRAAGENI